LTKKKDCQQEILIIEKRNFWSNLKTRDLTKNKLYLGIFLQFIFLPLINESHRAFGPFLNTKKK